MKAKGILLTLVVLLGLLFAVLNWQALFATVPVNLLLDTVQVPLGITLLVLLVAVSLLFFLTSLWERANQLRQVTHMERLVESLQARLDRQRSSELSALEAAMRDRFDDVRRQIETDSGRLETNLGESLSAMEARGNQKLDELESRQSERLAEVQERVVLVRNELAADIGELEDRLQLALGGGEASETSSNSA